MITVLVNCATKYEGPKPDFTLKGEASEKEIEKFTLHSGGFLIDASSFRGMQMGADRTFYKGESLESIITEVSPRAMKQFRSSIKWRKANYYAFAAALAVAVASQQDKGSDLESYKFAYFGLIGVGLSFIIVAEVKTSYAVDYYNEDLKKKFVPTMSYNFRF